MPDATPIFTTRDPVTGAVLFDFTGHIHAEGLDLDATESAGTPADDNSIRWIRQSDGQVSSRVGTFSIPGSERLTVDVGRNTGIRPGIDFNLGKAPNARTLTFDLGVNQAVNTLGSAGNLQAIMPRVVTIPSGTALSNGYVVYTDLKIWVDPFGYYNIMGEIQCPNRASVAGEAIATGATIGSGTYIPFYRYYWPVTGNSGGLRGVGMFRNGTLAVWDFGGPMFNALEVFNLGAGGRHRYDYAP